MRAQFDKVRRRLEELGDQAWALSWSKLHRCRSVEQFDGISKFALVVVNFSTTRYLKLMLLTLAEQTPLELLKRIIIVDNYSQDGGAGFLRRLADQIDLISLVENRLFLNHACGMRSGFTRLHELETGLDKKCRTNIVISCDSDVVFRRKDTLTTLAKIFVDQRAA